MGSQTFIAQKFRLTIAAFFLGLALASAQCPTVADPTQSFCDLESPTVANLQAVSNGNGLAWYSTPTGGTPLPASAGLVHGGVYYADNSLGNCGDRPSVTVTIYRRPEGQAFQGPCVETPGEATLADLIVVGNNIRWYTAPNGGTPLPLSTVLVEGTIYYASQTNPDTGCETSRLAVLATIGVVPVPTGPAVQQFCAEAGGVMPTVGNLQATGNNNWYLSPSAAVPLDLSTPLIDGQFYYATTVDPPCESDNRLEVQAILVEPANPGTGAEISICEVDVAESAPINLFGQLGGNPQTDGIWSGPVLLTNGYQGALDVTSLTVAESPYVFTYTVNATICGPSSSTVSVSVLPMPVASISGSTTICSESTASATITGTPGATVTYTVNGGSNQTITLDSNGLATITGTYAATSTITLVSVASAGTPSCVVPLKESITIVVVPLPNAAIASDMTICSGDEVAVTFTGTPNATVSYSVDGGPAQTILLDASGNAVLSGSYTSTTTISLISISSAGSPVCIRPLSGSVTITVVPPPTVTISGSTTVCPDTEATVTFTGTPGGIVSYTVNDGPVQTIVLNASGTASISSIYSQTTVYQLVAITTSGEPACDQPVSGTVTVEVLPPPTVSISADATICPGESATITFTGTPNATVTYVVNSGLSQSIVLDASGLASITGTFDADTTFELVSVASDGNPSCVRPATGSVTITVVPLPVASVSASQIICPNDVATVTFSGTPNAIVSFTVNGGAVQTITLDSTGTASITSAYSVTTVISLVIVATSGDPACEAPLSESITITVVPLPTVTISSDATICPGETATVTFSGTPGSVVSYNINGGEELTITLSASGVATVVNSYLETAVFNLISVSTSGEATCPNPVSGSVTITVLPPPMVTISEDATICPGETATVTFNGTPGAVVTFNTGDTNQTVVLDESGTASFTSTYTATTVISLVSVATTGTPSCMQPASGSVTITVIPPPTVSMSIEANPVCSGADAIINFIGTPDAIVTISIGGSTQAVVLDGSGAGILELSVTENTTVSLVSVTTSGDPECTSPASGSVTINVLPLPTASISGNTTICPGAEATVTFTGTPNALVTYTVNGGPDQTITLDGSGTAILTTVYDSPATISLVSVTSDGIPPCTQPAEGVVIIDVQDPPVITISGDATICAGETATVAFSGTPGSVVTYNINGGANQQIVLDDSGAASLISTFGVTSTINLVSAVTSGTPGCSAPQTGAVIITVIQPPQVSVSGSTTICSGSEAVVTFTGTPNAVVSYNINGGPTLTINLGATGSTSITGVYTSDVIINLISIATSGTTECTETVSGSVTITVVPLPTASISAVQEVVCSGSSAEIIFTGTPDAVVAYTVNGGATLTIILNESGTAVLLPVVAIESTYSLVSASTQNPECVQMLSGSVTVSVSQQPNAGADVAEFEICGNAEPVDLFTLLGLEAQAGGIWSPMLSSGTGIFNPAVDAPGTYLYTVNGSSPCPDDTSFVTVTVIPPANAGEDGETDICSNSDPVDLFALLGPEAQPGGTWSPALNGNIFDPAVHPEGNYTYTVVGPDPCGVDSAVVEVSVTPGPDAGQDGSLTLCVDSESQDLFDFLGGTPDEGGEWSPSLASGTGIFDPSVDAPGMYTYTFFGDQPCDNDTATVIVTVNPIPDAGNDGTAFFCSNHAPADLINFLEGTPQEGGTWSPSLASGTGVFNPAVDAPGVYIYSVGGNFCSLDTATVTVTVGQSPNAGGPGQTLNVCETSASISLSSGLNGSQGVGTWTDQSGAEIGDIFNPSAAGVGTYVFTYTVGGGVSPCLFDTATVTVVVEPTADAGDFTGIESVCRSVGTFDLSTLLSGQIAGGLWTNSAGVTVNEDLDVSLFAPGNYTYTYTVSNSCGTDSTTVQFTILPFPTLSIPNVTLTTPICTGEDSVIHLSGMVDGSYIIHYNLSGANDIPGLTATVVITDGTGSFTIPTSSLPNVGITTITFESIVNAVTECITVLGNVLVNVVISAPPVIESVNLNVAGICQNTPLPVSITNAQIADGSYQFQFEIPGATPSTGTSPTVFISGGNGQFVIPASYFATATGNQTLTITGIISLTGCSNTSTTASAEFAILPAPDVSGATLSAGDICANFSNTITISGASSLADGTYTIGYQLSGASSATGTAEVTISGGTGTFELPAAALLQNGSVSVSITGLISSVNGCGASVGSIAPVTFDVSQPETPQLVAGGENFCEEDAPTVASLSQNIIGSAPVVWYDAPEGGNMVDETLPLVDGATYYASVIAGSGCESDVRLEVTVYIEKCEQDDILIPDGFSPNGDGINDEFVIINLPERYPNFRLEIYNRYGNILYKGNRNTPNWNGRATEGGAKLGSGEVPVGVYFFVLEFNDGERKPMQGRLYLSR